MLVVSAAVVCSCGEPTDPVTASRQWAVQNSGTVHDLRAVWGSAANDVFAVGGGGTILHYDGIAWTAHASGTSADLWDVWGISPTNVFAVGRTGMLHFDGATWRPQDGVPQATLFGIWGDSTGAVFAVGQTAIAAALVLRYNGTVWRADTLPTGPAFFGVWGSSSSNVIAVGVDAGIWRYNGSGWTHDLAVDRSWALGSAWGSSANDQYAVGRVMNNIGGGRSLVLHYDGTRWTRRSELIFDNLSFADIWGSSADDVVAVGHPVTGAGEPLTGTILHYNGLRWSREAANAFGPLGGVWGIGDEVFAVGPSGLIVHGSR
ncbi:MAG: hypothetical protein ACREMN_02540 [Gemmatimonadales bacterium]